MTDIDLARFGAAAPPDDARDDRRASVMWWVVPTFAFWCGVIAWWLA